MDAMSGDETDYDEDGRPYLVTTHCAWRSKEATDLFKVCDALDLSRRFQLDDRPNAGHFPKVRKVSRRPDQRPVPRSLPQNLYDPEFVRSLNEEDLGRLDIQPSFTFMFPTSVLR